LPWASTARSFGWSVPFPLGVANSVITNPANSVTAIAADAAGNAYVTGSTSHSVQIYVATPAD